MVHSLNTQRKVNLFLNVLPFDLLMHQITFLKIRKTSPYISVNLIIILFTYAQIVWTAIIFTPLNSLFNVPKGDDKMSPTDISVILSIK